MRFVSISGDLNTKKESLDAEIGGMGGHKKHEE
jgi:hypothetical protein